MAAVALQGTPTWVANATSASSVAVSVPTGVVAGELLIAHVQTGSGAGSIATPTGWTLIKTGTDGTDAVGWVGYRVATGSEPASYTWTLGAANGTQEGAMFRLSGADTTTPVRTSAISTTGTGASATPPSLTGVTATDMMLEFWSGGDSGGATQTAPTMPGAPWTTLYTKANGSKATAGSYATGNQSAPTLTGSSSNLTWVQISVAIQAAPGLVQSNTGSVASVSGTSFTVTLPTATASGNTLILAYNASANFAAPSGWTLLRQSDAWNDLHIYYKATVAGETSWSIAGTSGGKAGWYIREQSGTVTFDQTAVGNSGSTAVTSQSVGPTATLSSANELVMLFVGYQAATSTIAASGYTQDANVGLSTASLWVAEMAVAATTAVSASVTSSASTQLAAIIGTFPLASTTSTTSPVTATAAATATIGTAQTDPKALAATGAATAGVAGAPPTSPVTATAAATVSFTAVTPVVVPPAPVPDPVVIPPPVRRMTVTVYDKTYTRVGVVPNFISCTVTFPYLGVGPGELVVAEDDPIAPYLLTADQNVVPVLVDLGNGVRWSGRVDTAILERLGPPGSGVITASLVDDWTWSQWMLASQNAASSTLTSMPQFDTRTGPAASVAADFINASAARLAVPVVASKPSPDSSPSVTLSARMTTLADLLTAPLKTAGVTMSASIWLAGETQPPGLSTTLTTTTVVFAPVLLADKPWLQWTDAMTNISKMTFQAAQPRAYRAVVGLAGQDAARTYDQYTDTTRSTALGSFGLPETYADASQAALGTPSQNAAKDALVATRGTASATFEVTDAAPWVFGTDYVVGDMATIVVSGSTWRQRITKVTAHEDRSTGLVFTPVIGDSTPDISGNDMMVLALARVAQGLRALQAGR